MEISCREIKHPASAQAKLWQVSSERLRYQAFELGAALLSLQIKDDQGSWQELIRGTMDPGERLRTKPYFSTLIGRCANRIAQGRYRHNAQLVQLEQNEGENHLHGGSCGLHSLSWQTETLADGLAFTLTSPAGASGYPGEAKFRLSYKIASPQRLELIMEAECAADCPLNLTHHNYFNLDPKASDIREHRLWLNASTYTPTAVANIPTGLIASCSQTALDFSSERRLGELLEPLAPELTAAGGFDHNFVLQTGDLEQVQARLSSPSSQISLKLYTDLPGLQVYSCNSPAAGKDFLGRELGQYFALCLEPQFFPNAINQSNFASPLLLKGQKYKRHINYEFEVQKRGQ